MRKSHLPSLLTLFVYWLILLSVFKLQWGSHCRVLPILGEKKKGVGVGEEREWGGVGRRGTSGKLHFLFDDGR